MSDVTLIDAEARRRIAEDLETTLVVEAAAGTGKTTALSARILSLVTTGRGRLAEVVAVTFTEKAAGELKLRLRADLERARERALGEAGTPEVRQRLDVALAELEAAHIGTIHGFCADLLRERPVEAGVDPLFAVAAEDTQARFFDDAFDAWFEGALASPGEGVRRVLRREADPRGVLRKAGWDLQEHRDFDAPWRVPVIDRETELAAVVARLVRLASLAPDELDPADWMDKLLVEIRRVLVDAGHGPGAAAGATVSWDRTEVLLKKLARAPTWGYAGRKRLYGTLPRADVLLLRDDTKRALDDVIARAEAELGAQLREDLRALLDGYDAQKARAGALDFLDLLLKTRALLQLPIVRAELSRRVSHLLVDEFQDTDPLQAEILLLLAGAGDVDGPAALRPTPGKLFVVGDPKQSIYRFRRADVSLYERIKRRLVLGGAEVLHLSASFRATGAVQTVINAAFAPEMQGDDDGIQAAYVPLSAVRTDRPPSPQPSVIVLPVPRPFGYRGKVRKGAIELSLPDAVGALVDWLVRGSGYTVTERGRPERVPLAARHVCLLFKRMTWYGGDVTRDYVRALEARDLPHVLMGGRSYHAREEVRAMLSALGAIEWPDDELSVYATLRGPFFALTDAALLEWKLAVGNFHTLRKHELAADATPALREVSEALSLLGRLHPLRNRRPVADTIGELLDATRAHAGVAMWRSGKQALGNVLRMMDLARRFESSGALSFRGFLSRLSDEAERGGAGDAPLVEDGADGVRLINVHKAKGLEFPVVILCDPTAPLSWDRPSRWTDPSRGLCALPLAGCTPADLLDHAPEVLLRDHAEGVRLAYVAATRARDLLVIPAVTEGALEGSWLSPLWRAIYPTREGWRDPGVAEGCPAFTSDGVLDRPFEADDPERGVAPGAHVGESGDAGDTDNPPRVVWWDAHVLDLGREDASGLRQEALLSAGDDATGGDAGERAYRDWRASRDEALGQGVTPRFRIETATAAAALAASAKAVPIERTSSWDGDSLRAARPHGPRFGTLVHAVLAEVPLLEGAGEVASHVGPIAERLGHLLMATADEVQAAAQAVTAALAHPLMIRAFAAGPRREAPIVVKRADGVMVEGIIDLAFRETAPGAAATWVVVDYKTDIGLVDPAGKYAAQLALYVEALEGATGEKATAVLLRV